MINSFLQTKSGVGMSQRIDSSPITILITFDTGGFYEGIETLLKAMDRLSIYMTKDVFIPRWCRSTLSTAKLPDSFEIFFYISIPSNDFARPSFSPDMQDDIDLPISRSITLNVAPAQATCFAHSDASIR